jgi:hypothetical protein
MATNGLPGRKAGRSVGVYCRSIGREGKEVCGVGIRQEKWKRPPMALFCFVYSAAYRRGWMTYSTVVYIDSYTHSIHPSIHPSIHAYMPTCLQAGRPTYLPRGTYIHYVLHIFEFSRRHVHCLQCTRVGCLDVRFECGLGGWVRW